MSNYFHIFDAIHLQSLLSIREGETKLGEEVQIPSKQNDWQQSIDQSTAKFVLIGIPEDIGVRANLGIGGADTAWAATLKSLLNIQSTALFSGKELLILGAFHFDEWMKIAENSSFETLRELVAQIDDEVFPIIQKIIAAGKIPIVIGGGHNNSYPLLKGASLAFGKAINCINLDAHSDYRQMEGRHSGNGFRYAKKENYLSKYALIGLHENYNSAAIIADMQANPDIDFSYFEDIFIRQKSTFEAAINKAIEHTQSAESGIELDLDCIENTLSSAQSPSGISTTAARQFLHQVAQKSKPCYLHLAEGATTMKNGNSSNQTGKLIVYLISDFIKSY